MVVSLGVQGCSGRTLSPDSGSSANKPSSRLLKVCSLVHLIRRVCETQRNDLTSMDHPGFGPNFVQKFLILVTIVTNRGNAASARLPSRGTTALLRARRGPPSRTVGDEEAHKLAIVAHPPSDTWVDKYYSMKLHSSDQMSLDYGGFQRGQDIVGFATIRAARHELWSLAERRLVPNCVN